MSEIGLFDAMYSQRALRYFGSDPVPDEMIRKVIEAATKAPSGSNAQDWAFVVVKDPDRKGKIAAYYKRAWDSAFGSHTAAQGSLSDKVMSSASHLADHMGDAPLLILACIKHHGGPTRLERGASIYPAVQNMLLAARGLGLASVLTTLHKQYEEQVKEVLGIPEDVETAALLPLGWPAKGVRYGPNKRKPLDEVTHYDQWKQPN